MFNKKLRQEIYGVLEAYSKLTSQQSRTIIDQSQAIEAFAKQVNEILQAQSSRINQLENKIESITKSSSS